MSLRLLESTKHDHRRYYSTLIIQFNYEINYNYLFPNSALLPFEHFYDKHTNFDNKDAIKINNKRKGRKKRE